MATLHVRESALSRWGIASWVVVLLVVAAMIGSYAPNFASLMGQWDSDPNYTYGYFVIPIALAILWHRRGLLDPSALAPRWWGFLPLLAVLALRVLLYERNEQYLELVTIPFVLAGLALALGGWHLLRVSLPAIGFLFFMYPLPPRLNFLMSEPLQRVATWGSVALLQASGVPALAEGNVIVVGSEQLEVARACNGLSMLLSFVTLITATVILVQRPIWERIILLASAIPIALISNILRIYVTALCYRQFGHDAGERIAHDPAGWAMVPVALALVGLELYILSRLFVEDERRAAPDLQGLGAARAKKAAHPR